MLAVARMVNVSIQLPDIESGGGGGGSISLSPASLIPFGQNFGLTTSDGLQMSGSNAIASYGMCCAVFWCGVSPVSHSVECAAAVLLSAGVADVVVSGMVLCGVYGISGWTERFGGSSGAVIGSIRY